LAVVEPSHLNAVRCSIVPVANRANGLVAGVDMDGFTVSVRESFGNFPQYIHVRMWRSSDPSRSR
jgi:hypothetical protein